MRHLDLFSGIGGFSLAFERAGFRTVAFSEIEKFPCRVLAYHWPNVPNMGDITKINGADIQADIVTGGFPCQDLSVAGRRAGLKGERSGLFWQIIRIIREMQEAKHGPTFAVLENVPGLFSSHRGRDFATVLRGLAELRPLDIAWAVLDAQYFGVPQRRRRVFVVADFRGARAAEILALTESVRRHPTAGGKAKEGATAVLGGGAQGRGWCDDLDRATFVPCALSLNAHGQRLDGESETFVVGTLDDCSYGLTNPGHGGRTHSCQIMVPPRKEEDASTQEGNAVTILRRVREEIGAQSFTEWGLGILVSFLPQEVLRQALHGCGIRPTPFTGGWLVCCTSPRKEDRAEGAMLTVHQAQCAGRTSSQREPSRQLARELGAYLQELSQPGPSPRRLVRDLWHASEGIGILRETLSAIQEVWESFRLQTESIYADSVRRLTAEEYEFLQGFPRNWTAVGNAADGPRYRALGNAVAVPVVEWIALRMADVLRSDSKYQSAERGGEGDAGSGADSDTGAVAETMGAGNTIAGEGAMGGSGSEL